MVNREQTVSERGGGRTSADQQRTAPGSGRPRPSGGSARRRTSRRATADPVARHRAAVENTLRWADQAAGRGDFRAALAWLAWLDLIGEELPDGYGTKRAAWRSAQGREAA